MGTWILGLVIFWGLVFIINCFSHRQDNSLTEEDYKRMQRKWAEEKWEEEMFDDYVEAETEVQKERIEIARGIIQRHEERTKKSNKEDNPDDLPF